jgi:hypothetical protein
VEELERFLEREVRGFDAAGITSAVNPFRRRDPARCVVPIYVGRQA